MANDDRQKLNERMMPQRETSGASYARGADDEAMFVDYSILVSEIYMDYISYFIVFESKFRSLENVIFGTHYYGPFRHF